MAYRIGKCLLSEYLREINMPQAELASRLGVSRQQVNKWFKGEQKMSMESAMNVLAVLGIDGLHIEDLYKWIEARS